MLQELSESRGLCRQLLYSYKIHQWQRLLCRVVANKTWTICFEKMFINTQRQDVENASADNYNSPFIAFWVDLKNYTRWRSCTWRGTNEVVRVAILGQNTWRSTNVVWILVRRLRRRPKIQTTLDQDLMLAGNGQAAPSARMESSQDDRKNRGTDTRWLSARDPNHRAELTGPAANLSVLCTGLRQKIKTTPEKYIQQLFSERPRRCASKHVQSITSLVYPA